MVNEELQAAILEEAMKEVTKSPELVTKVLHNLNEIGADGQMGQAFVENPDRDDSYIPLYSTFDGTVSNVLAVMAPKLMRKRVPRIPEAPREKWGQLAFSLTAPTDIPARQKLLCDLHPNNAKREWLDEIGLSGRFCPKSNLRNAYEVQRHRRLYHNDENHMIEQAEAREREKQLTDYQKNIGEILANQARGGRRSAE